jgi:CRP-like cAMP-binding protein|eukprot:COSAG06_NODE_1_length_58652_cov_31.600967_8_plen_76_part_00
MRGEICKALKLARYKPGQAICTQGEPGDAFYVMLSGSITISKDGRDVNIMSTPGTGFGEVALDRDAVRTHELFVR